MTSIKENLRILRSGIPANVKLVAVSKMQPISSISEVYSTGQRRFGENKVQDLVEKYPQLPNDIEWHFIGHLQTNKVKFIAPFIKVIHSIDSLKLLKEINKEALQHQRVIDCLLELYIASEETKFGLDLSEARQLLSSAELSTLRNIHITGVMGMATYSTDISLIHQEFRTLKENFDKLSKEYFANDPGFCEISMGMSGDYAIAIEEGSTMVRIGTALFSNEQ